MSIVNNIKSYLFRHSLRIQVSLSTYLGSMQLSFLLSAVSLLQLGALTSAHSDGDLMAPPKVFGGRSALGRLPRHMMEEIQGYTAAKLQGRDWSTPDVDTHDAKHKRCGPGVGFCAPGDWYVHCKMSLQLTLKANRLDSCSPVGYCGRGYQHCASPNCQIDYSDGCDATVKPLGEPTLNVSRPLIGNVSYDGAGITQCKNPGTVALTFDDGPYNYTSHVLDVLASYGAKATFFITGNNLGKGQIDVEETGWPAIIRRMHADGHQVRLVKIRYHCSLTHLYRSLRIAGVIKI